VIELGGNIELVGFRELEPSKLVVVKKIVGNYARKMADSSQKFEKLTISMRPVGTEGKKFEVKSKVMDNGTPYASEVTDFNLFVVLDRSLSKVYTSMNK
jgi:hypothetical protein